MSLYDEIPEGLFSILASKNKCLYSKALFVVFEAFNCKLKIRKDELVSMLESRLEDDIYSADLDDDFVNITLHNFLKKNEFFGSPPKFTKRSGVNFGGDPVA